MKSFYPEDYVNDVAQDDLYAGLLTGEHGRANTKSISDRDYARLYVDNLFSHLVRLGLNKSGGIVDAGSGIGAVAEAFYNSTGGPVWGIDMSPAATTYAKRTFKGPTFICGSAHQLDDIKDGSLSLFHAREFYPFSRSNDGALHRMFIDAALPKMSAGGVFAIVQIKDPAIQRGFHEQLGNLEDVASRAGYQRSGMMVMTPQRLAKRLKGLSARSFVYPFSQIAGKTIERIKPGKVTFIYWLQA